MFKRLKGMLERSERWLAYSWNMLRDGVEVLRPCRFSALVIVAAALLLITDQGQELTRRLGGEGASNRETILFFVFVAYWAFQSWYWARLMLDTVLGLERKVSFPDRLREARVAWMIRHLPRVLALAAFLIAAGTLLFSSAYILAGLTAILGAGFYALLVKRQDWLPESTDSRTGRFFLPPHGVTNYKDFKNWPVASKVVLGLSLAIDAVAITWICIDPAALGTCLGAAAASFFGFACIVPIGGLLVFISHRGGAAATGKGLGWESARESYPAVRFLLLLAVMCGLIVDNHEIRIMNRVDGVIHTKLSAGSKAVERVDNRSSFPEALQKWYDGLPDSSRSAKGGAPMIIVATAGGGSRAAYWTATVLGALEDANPSFSRHLFAISGVSGGSLGATVYRTLLTMPDGSFPTAPEKCDADLPDVVRGRFECAGQRVLSRDFLGPVVGALLFPDLLQRFVPANLFPDRARALEEAWEQAWEPAGFRVDTWKGRAYNTVLAAPSPRQGALPALFLNGTDVGSGKRVITSNVKIDNSVFVDAYDFFEQVDSDVSVATAVLNSARFTYVSPAGTMKKNGLPTGRIIDGGYFENFGAVTALQIVRGAHRILGDKVTPIFIQISSDPKLHDWDLPDWGEKRLGFEPGERYLNEVLSPIRGLLSTRDARGVLAAKQLFEKEPGVSAAQNHFHFRLCPVSPGKRVPALGWVLSQSIEQDMRRGLHQGDCSNHEEFEQLKAMLARYSVPPSVK